MTSAKKPIMLIIMDGFGCSSLRDGNAVAQADLQVLPKLVQTYPHAQLEASGEAVGLPEGQIGNSEVGHLNIGSGRVVYQELTRITRDIKEGTFFQKPVLIEAMQQAVRNNKALHIMGLVSPGGVHSSQAHVYALLEMASFLGNPLIAMLLGVLFAIVALVMARGGNTEKLRDALGKSLKDRKSVV